MRIALIGATGFVGARVLDRLLDRGHDVSALVRRPRSLPKHDRVVAVGLDVQDPDRLGVPVDRDRIVRAVAGHDLVVSCFNPGHDLNANPNLYRDVVEGTRAIIDGVKRAGVRRFLYLGGAGSLLAPSGRMLVDDLEFFGELVRHPPKEAFVPEGPPILDIPRAARIALNLLQVEQDFEWIFLSPSLYLGDYGGGTGKLRYGTNQLLLAPDGRSARLDVSDLAQAIVEQAERPIGCRVHITVATNW